MYIHTTLWLHCTSWWNGCFVYTQNFFCFYYNNLPAIQLNSQNVKVSFHIAGWTTRTVREPNSAAWPECRRRRCQPDKWNCLVVFSSCSRRIATMWAYGMDIVPVCRIVRLDGHNMRKSFVEWAILPLCIEKSPYVVNACYLHVGLSVGNEHELL